MLQFGNKLQTGKKSNGRNFPPGFKLQLLEIKLLLSKLEIMASQQSSYSSLLLRIILANFFKDSSAYIKIDEFD